MAFGVIEVPVLCRLQPCKGRRGRKSISGVVGLPGVFQRDMTMINGESGRESGRRGSNKVSKGTAARVVVLRLVSVAQRLRLNSHYLIG